MQLPTIIANIKTKEILFLEVFSVIPDETLVLDKAVLTTSFYSETFLYSSGKVRYEFEPLFTALARGDKKLKIHVYEDSQQFFKGSKIPYSEFHEWVDKLRKSHLFISWRDVVKGFLNSKGLSSESTIHYPLWMNDYDLALNETSKIAKPDIIRVKKAIYNSYHTRFFA